MVEPGAQVGAAFGAEAYEVVYRPLEADRSWMEPADWTASICAGEAEDRNPAG